MRRLNNFRVYMNVNVILTFNTCDVCGDTQEFFDLKVPVAKNEENCVAFLMQGFFPRIVKKCLKYNRSVEDLIKISTAGDWDLFEKVTALPTLPDLGHNGKWYFGLGRKDLGPWDEILMKKYGFGTTADLSHYFEQNEQISCR